MICIATHARIQKRRKNHFSSSRANGSLPCADRRFLALRGGVIGVERVYAHLEAPAPGHALEVRWVDAVARVAALALLPVEPELVEEGDDERADLRPFLAVQAFAAHDPRVRFEARCVVELLLEEHQHSVVRELAVQIDHLARHCHVHCSEERLVVLSPLLYDFLFELFGLGNQLLRFEEMIALMSFGCREAELANVRHELLLASTQLVEESVALLSFRFKVSPPGRSSGAHARFWEPRVH
mmetsp:Transcript_9728/g.31839  ORF Transcript_9728/g.31839 Transcript_9728/m.31839 type:complete len:241 (-) Transcript_9728:2342-3064(-)